MVRKLFVLLLALPLIATAQAQWKWRDAQGRTQYSDRPPPAEVAEKDILARPPGALRPRLVQVQPVGEAPSAPAPAAPKASTAVERSAASDKAKQAAAEEAKKKAEKQRVAEQRAENCRVAREQVASLQSGVRLSRVNAQGEREYLDDAQRSQAMQRAQAAVASECK